MQNIHSILAALAGSVAVFTPPPTVHAETVQENFDANPAGRGWLTFGEAGLFRWNSTNRVLEVTWDSARPNSYFLRPLGTILNKSEDFSLAFDLFLNDIAVGTTPGKPFTFELAIGFLNLGQASQTNFLRGTGTQSPNVAEFDYFPDSGFGATISPTIISSNHQFATTFNSPLELTTNALFHVEMRYTSTNQTLTTALARDGAAWEPIQPIVLGPEFTDFRVDHFAISSYSDDGQGLQFAGSILAHAGVDNIVITVPPPPVAELAGLFDGQQRLVQFQARSNWVYSLERTLDFKTWTTLSRHTDSTGGKLVLADTNAPSASAQFYRVKAERP